MEDDKDVVVRIKIDKRFWESWIKGGASQRGEPVQEFAANLMKIGARIVEKKEDQVEGALLDAEKKFMDRGFRVLRGGAVLFSRTKELNMELLKEGILFQITYKGLWVSRISDSYEEDWTFAGAVWSTQDFERMIDESVTEAEKKISQEGLKIAEETFSDVLKDYAKLNIHGRFTGRML